jgi:hypothetical protein
VYPLETLESEIEFRVEENVTNFHGFGSKMLREIEYEYD